MLILIVHSRTMPLMHRVLFKQKRFESASEAVNTQIMITQITAEHKLQLPTGANLIDCS